MNRRKKLYWNTGSALLNQLVALICGFILPRYILAYYGSEVNGLVTSITQFLGIIAFLEMGIGPVIQSNLYKPLAENDKDTISKIMVSAERFYKKIAYIFLVYIVVLIIVFPRIKDTFDVQYTVSLLIIISISTFAQYFFGITYQVFLNADQKIYVHATVQIVTTILNTILCVLLMRLGFGIHVVKLASTVVFIARPIVQNIYVHMNYDIDSKITYTEEPIKQKWNGFAQHLASTVCVENDVILLTLFSSYSKVSIYSVYFLVVNGITKLIMTSVAGLEALWGNMIAKNENELLLKTYEGVEAFIHLVVSVLFVSTAILIAPFVSVYTAGLSDTKAYYVPLFGALLTFGFGAQCLRIPYFRIIKAAGHYKQTQNGALISMLLNILVSISLVFKYDLIGVAIGTVVAMLYHTLYFAWYLRKNILNRSFKHIIVHLIVDSIIGAVAFIITGFFSMKGITYAAWILYAIKVSIVVVIIAAPLNFIIYRKEFSYLIKKLLRRN